MGVTEFFANQAYHAPVVCVAGGLLADYRTYLVKRIARATSTGQRSYDEICPTALWFL